MNSFLRMLNAFGGVRRARKPARRPSHPAPQGRPVLEALEDRTVPSTISTITANFNPTPIPAGDGVWFDSSFKVSGLGSATSVTLHVTGQTVTFAASGTNYTVNVPDSTITLSKTTTVATTTFDAGTNTWITSLPISFGGNAFLGGGTLPLSVALPGGISAVTWSGQFATDTSGVTVSWQWGAAAYTSFSSDYAALNVKPLDGGGNVTVYNNGDHAGTPEAYKASVSAGATGNGGGNWTGNLTPAKNVTLSTGALLYPFPSSNPLTSVTFSESSCLVAAKLDVANGTFDVWYTDEHALSLGVRQVNVITAGGTTTTNYPVAALTSDPGAATSPAVGTTATSGDQAGIDPSGRPIAPSLYITDITNNPNSLSGDWQYGGTAIAPSAVFGAWKGAVRTVNYTTSPATVTVTCDADPARNGSNLGAGADTPPVSVGGEGYSAEVRWSLTDLYNQGVLIPGHIYRFYVMVHDGDQNKSGGDAGQAAYDYTLPAPATSSISGYVYLDNYGTGVMTSGDSGLQGIAITLTGTDYLGHTVNVSVVTDSNGFYSFTGLLPGTYTVTKGPAPSVYTDEASDVGTVNGSTDGASLSVSVISQISLAAGQNGINYDFAELLQATS
jgi:hypothetical protein